MDGAKRKLEELDMTMRETLVPFGDAANALAALGRLAILRSH